MGEDTERACVVREARRWVGTPYRHRARVLGSGVDCAQILIAVFAGAGLIEDFDPGFYTSDWHLHRSEDIYADQVGRYAAEFDPAQGLGPADIVLFKHGRTFSHGAIVTAWPSIVHAFAGAGLVEEIDASKTPLMRLAGQPRPMRAFSYWRR